MARRELLKAINRTAILNIIKTYGPIARADIAQRAKLSPATVSGLTAELINDGLIYEKQEGASRGGRPPVLLALDSTAVYVVGIKLAEEHATLALANINADLVPRIPFNLSSAIQSVLPTSLPRAFGACCTLRK